MQRYYGILWKVYVGDTSMRHGPRPASERLLDAYKKINPDKDVFQTALVRPDDLRRLNDDR